MAHHRTAYYIINGITIYRIVAAPILLLLLFLGRIDIFKWLLPLSFFTDFIDGWLSRRYKVSSIMGAKLDSIGDDLTVAVGVVGIFVTRFSFVEQQLLIFILLLILFLVQVVFAFARYGKMTNFHTYLAKLAALLQGLFLIFFYFLTEPFLPLFYLAAFITGIQLIEEIILIRLLPEWTANVKGLWWVGRRSQ